jgi:nucleoside phosphorylase
MKCDILVLAALSEERSPFVDHAKANAESNRQHSGKHGVYEVFCISESIVVVPVMSGMGQLNSTITYCKAMEDVSPRFVLLLGIAGCMLSKEQAQLGDIAVSESIIDYEIEKIYDDVTKNEPRSKEYQCAPNLIKIIKDAGSGSWCEQIQSSHPNESPPKIHFGPVLSGNILLASTNMKREFQKRFPKAVAIEMEAAGIAAVTTQYEKIESTHILMIKSFTDWADASKDDSKRSFCTDAAALYAINLIRSVLATYVKNLPENPSADRDLLVDMNRILDSFAGSSEFPSECFKHAAQQITGQTVQEVVDLNTGYYRVDLGNSHQFLLRASPFFKLSRKTYATSLDKVSTFWTNPENVENSRRYLEAQTHPGSTVHRLFIFSSAEKAHYHSQVLDAHQRKYSNVFVTSISNYTQLLAESLAPNNSDSYLQRDYAVLEYGPGNRYFGELSDRYFHINPVIDDNQIKSEHLFADRFVKLMENLCSSLEPGDLSDEYSILRWNFKHAQSNDWPKNLAHLFGREPGMLHVVGFDVPEDVYIKIREKLANLKYKINDVLQDKYEISDIKLYKRIFYNENNSPRDGLTESSLHVSEMNSVKYILSMRFTSRMDLHRYYSDPFHSVYRRKIYADLEKVIGVHLEEIEEAILTKAPYHKLLHELIEKAVAHRIFRLDFVEDEPFTDIVRSDPYRY